MIRFTALITATALLAGCAVYERGDGSSVRLGFTFNTKRNACFENNAINSAGLLLRRPGQNELAAAVLGDPDYAEFDRHVRASERGRDHDRDGRIERRDGETHQELCVTDRSHQHWH